MSNKVNVILIAILIGSSSTASITQHVTLAERVKLNGMKPITISVLPETFPLPISELTRKADIVLEAMLVPLRSYLSDDQAKVYTDYQIVSKRSIHSRIPDVSATPGPRPPLIITLLGGEVTIDGTKATVEDATRKPLNPNGSFLLFARKGKGDNRFTLIGGSAGIFEVTDGQRVSPLYERIDADPEVDGVPFDEIVRRIQAAPHK